MSQVVFSSTCKSQHGVCCEYGIEGGNYKQFDGGRVDRAGTSGRSSVGTLGIHDRGSLGTKPGVGLVGIGLCAIDRW